MSGNELVSRGTRGRFRQLMTDSTLGEISTAFQDEGFAPSPDCTYEDSSQRRSLTEEYLEAVDWADRDQVARVLRVFERLMEGFEQQHLVRFIAALRRDGFEVNEENQIAAPSPRLSTISLANIRDPSAIQENLDRIHRSIADDPAQVVGSAKELIESTAKTVLIERGQTVDEHEELPTLVRRAQKALDLHPSVNRNGGPDGSEAVKKILGSVSGVAIGVAELRNRGYGTGHGGSTARIGIGERHAHLAVNATITWCQLMLDTLTDAGAPWRKTSREEQ